MLNFSLLRFKNYLDLFVCIASSKRGLLHSTFRSSIVDMWRFVYY